ncbi:hypothetical protein [Paenibacillus thermotolerans]|uniref:hypothetical protein n=1 Tax=Paenibacillus thermotolerans TaxID=3027807 RepID=UPI00236751ED|nr:MULTISPECIES: hypothetical protein [unclassified Paenibacillus]
MSASGKMFYCIDKDEPSEIVVIDPGKAVSLEEVELDDPSGGKMTVLTAEDGRQYIPLALMDEVQGKANAEILDRLLRQAIAAKRNAEG